ncbi:MAG TPA: tripartite tricarboxylate transporter substrate binding protein [Albitalea sp.]|uniref:tripartite tricarboxylate transporter substrate binding protein n=1 Tax=Piscinibacter sp. TaxID=1903157 RepID=UPI002ED67068
MRRRSMLVACGAAWIGAARAQPGFPGRPITLWVPWPPGGGTDVAMRILADAAAQNLGQPVVVENRAGAGGTLAMPVLQQAAPDGHTLAQVPQTVLRAPWMQRVGWDPIRDLTPILQVSGTHFGIVVPAASPFADLEALLAHAQSHPDAVTVASNGVGTTPHLVVDELMRRRSARWIHVPYKGTAEQAIAVASGQVMAAAGSTGFAPFIDSGALRLLATFGERRRRRWPQVPTLKELGHGLVAMSPWGLAGPRGMATAVVERLHEAFRAAMMEPRYREELAKSDQELAYLGPAAYAEALREGFQAERRVAERLGSS